MPAKDIFHDCFKAALIKDGWNITNDPYNLKVGKKDLFIDLVRVVVVQSRYPVRK